jgi:hypothetical protein
MYEVMLSLEAVEDVLRITLASGAKTNVISASKEMQDALRSDPAAAGEHLSMATGTGHLFISPSSVSAAYKNHSLNIRVSPCDTTSSTWSVPVSRLQWAFLSLATS